jgi:hypothetical protein
MQLICLANSRRQGGRCIAGIDRATGAWIRPVPLETDAIPESRSTAGATALSLLDVFDVETEMPRETPKYQRENRLLKSWNWVVRGRLPRAAIEPYVDDSAPLFHNTQDRVVAVLLDQLAPSKWKSLQLVRPRHLRFERDGFDSRRWRVRFKDRAGNEYLLSLTDPEATRRLEAGERIDSRCLLTVSLTQPWSGKDESMLKLCYKVVAAVIDSGE